ncbi:hypothetical protein KQX54_009537 [Cotesia glomerata]|uniref:Uncharacterized protein n=1 Tax=Cotesia glomerata TaxID=32391 RepID=A0AAV7IKY9_COTGL|nr:hypothetical protein KQX54_009537 [Cotesia glomerata]
MEKRPGLFRSGAGRKGSSFIAKGRNFDDLDPFKELPTSSLSTSIKKQKQKSTPFIARQIVNVKIITTIKKRVKCRVRDVIIYSFIVVQVQGHWTVDQLIKKLLQKQRKRNKPCRVRYPGEESQKRLKKSERMPGGRRGLVAPQNTFLENIIRRSSSQRKYSCYA